jgi:hypothetical protein
VFFCQNNQWAIDERDMAENIFQLDGRRSAERSCAGPARPGGRGDDTGQALGAAEGGSFVASQPEPSGVAAASAPGQLGEHERQAVGKPGPGGAVHPRATSRRRRARAVGRGA